ncbi:hypothetical protein AWE51_02395 [Aquimarina aggregata]|uniref:DUF6046 domain-containing protein n=1 Tax=Aquimarina aggregata TaxID=1642818 RepID=A0A163CDV2_9FLAO|nr:DUF6046 domain-containing protein [Aquimarina aggregata]KZS42310.1 hypothetical protein AWE51_02395 [Aquimarina aggregata]
MGFNINLKNALDQYDGLIDFAVDEAANLGVTEFKDFIIDKKGGEFNLPVFAPLVFEPLIKRDLVLPFMRIDAVTISVNRSKNIQTTAIEGRNHTIKEHISNGDFSINIDGLIADDEFSKDYPKGKLFLLKQFLNAPYSLRITHAILNRLGVHEIVIQSYSIPSIEGVKNIQKFSAQAISDEPLELIIRDNA